MAPAFNPGDTVRLKSGGPVMTVVEFASFSGSEGYRCRWFDDKHKLTEDVFTEAELERYVRPTGGSVRLGTTSKGF